MIVAARRSTSTVLLVGMTTGLVCLIAGVVLGGPVGPAFAGLGVVLPLLLVQDGWRYAFFAAGRGRSVGNALGGGASAKRFFQKPSCSSNCGEASQSRYHSA